MKLMTESSQNLLFEILSQIREKLAPHLGVSQRSGGHNINQRQRVLI